MTQTMHPATTQLKQPASGECYKKALLALDDQPLLNQFKRLGAFAQPILVHGYPRLSAGPLKGSKYGHAWLECGAFVLNVRDDLDALFVPKLVYYAAGQIDPEECRQYAPLVARELAADCGHAGPWEEPPDDAMFSD